MSTLLAVQRLKSPLYQQRVVLWNLLLLLWVATALAVVVYTTMFR
jgi:hypothetical protein